jgi:hypothetical protein
MQKGTRVQYHHTWEREKDDSFWVLLKLEATHGFRDFHHRTKSWDRGSPTYYRIRE